MIKRDGRLGRRLGDWVLLSARHARLVVIASIAVLLPMLWYAWTHLYVDADTGHLVSDRLPWRQANAALERDFPHLLDDMQVVIDAETPEIASEAQRRLAAALAGRPDLFSFVDKPDGGDYFERNAFLYSSREDLERLRDRMRDYRSLWVALEKDPTLGGLASVVGDMAADSAAADTSGALELAPVLQAVGGAFYSSRSGNVFVFPWSDLLRGRRSEPADLRRFVIAKPILDFSSSRPAGAAMRAIREAATRLDLDPRTYRIRITGSEAVEHESIDAGLSDVPLLVAGALIMVSIILFAGLRSFRLLFASLCVLAAGLVGTAAFAAAAVGGLNMISVAFAILYVGLGIDYAIHFCLNYVEARQETGSHLDGLRLTAERAGVALFLSAVTTALCFYAFMATDFTGVADLGRIGGTGMMISFVATVGLLPALLSLRPFRLPDPGPASFQHPPDRAAQGSRPMAWLDRAVTRWRTPILVSALLLAVGSAVLVPRVRFDQDVINMSDPSSESVVTLKELLDDPNTAVRAVSMTEPDSARAAAVAAGLDELDVVRATLTLNSFVPDDQEAKLRIISEVAADLGPPPDPDGGRKAAAREGEAGYERRLEAVDRLRETAADLYLEGDSATSAAARQLLYLIDAWRVSLRQWPLGTRHSMAAGLEQSLVGTLPWVQASFRRALDAVPVSRATLPASLRELWVAPNGIERVQVLPADRLDSPAKLRSFVEAVQAEEPAITGMPVENVELGKVTVRAFQEAFGLALLATAVTLLLLLGDPRASAIVMLSLMLATLLTGAAAVIWDVPFNISNVITLPLLLGIGVDAGIHMVHRRRDARPGESLLDTATGRAILYSALTTMAGFGNLTLASHRAISGMGALLMIGMTSVLGCTLIVLPAIMARPPKRDSRPAEAR
ncbi:MAG: MMPL family transporter [Candidatus Palauibacterales bacterium]|nr:MMPL family transporter [Candidatus Palauibacterales bacterium]